ncbi:MAG: hypothetical protein V1690_01575 [Candidatus Moraniibacteriota bacterium]
MKTKIISWSFIPTIFLLFALFQIAQADIENKLSCGSIRECILYAIGQLKWIVVGVTVVVIIIAGIIYLFSGANVSLAEKAKLTLLGAVLGFTIVIGADILISEVGRALGWKGAVDTEGGGAQGVITRTITFLFSILGAIGLGGILIGAIFYFAAAGDEERMKQGRKIVVYSIIGTVIALSAALIVRQIEKIVIQ